MAYSAGFYGFVMSSQYNSRCRACEILVDGSRAILARRRRAYEDLVALGATAWNRTPRSGKGQRMGFLQGSRLASHRLLCCISLLVMAQPGRHRGLRHPEPGTGLLFGSATPPPSPRRKAGFWTTSVASARDCT